MLVSSYLECLRKLKTENVRLVLVNDGSSKNVLEKDIAFLQNNIQNFKYISYPDNAGKGYALRKGVKESNAKSVIFTDIDFPYETDSIVQIYKSLKEGNDVALGFRKRDYYKKVPFFRQVLSKTLRGVMKSVLKLATTDTQCGLKGFNNKGKEDFLKTTINRFLFDLEYVQRVSKRKDLKLGVVPVKLRNDVTFSRVNVKILFTESINFLIILFRG